MVDAVHGVHLEDGGDEECHYPVVVDVVDVGIVTVNGGGEEGVDDLKDVFDKQQTSKDETEVGKNHNATQTTDGEIGTRIYLTELHTSETEGSDEVTHCACLTYGWGEGDAKDYHAYADDHEKGTEGEDDGLWFTELTHGMILLIVHSPHGCRY